MIASDKKRLTPVELELMEILWKLGKGNVHDVIAQLPFKRHLAYTSVSTILRILEQKKILTVKKAGRQHIYYPILSKQAFAEHAVKKIVKQIFSGNTVELAAYLINKKGISVTDIDALQEMLKARKKELGL